MMEWNDVGLKSGEDVLEALRRGGTANEMHKVLGERASGLIADALDIALSCCAHDFKWMSHNASTRRCPVCGAAEP